MFTNPESPRATPNTRTGLDGPSILRFQIGLKETEFRGQGHYQTQFGNEGHGLVGFAIRALIGILPSEVRPFRITRLLVPSRRVELLLVFGFVAKDPMNSNCILLGNAALPNLNK